ncbi:MAG: C-type lectin domain-containing protein [Polyangiaceae bacterium]
MASKLHWPFLALGLAIGCGRIGYDPLPLPGEGGFGDAAAGASSSGGASGGGASSGGDDGATGDGALADAAEDSTATGDSSPPDATGDVVGAADGGGDADAGPSCRAGCTCEWYFGHPYMFCPDTIVYSAARDTCRSYGMRLVRITSGIEHSYLRLRTKQDAYAKFHIGASDALMEGRWLWDDGTQFWMGTATPVGMAVNGKFAFWYPGEPNNQGGNENCGECQSLQGWNDSVCDFQAKPFICKRYHDPLPQCGDSVVQAPEACDTGGASASCNADCSVASCGDGIVNAAAGEVCDDGATGQYCNSTCTATKCPPGCQCFTSGNDYAICTTPAAFGDAEVYCGQHGYALSSVTSTTEDQTLRTHATSAGVTDYWLGGADIDNEGNWMWLDTTFFWKGPADAGTALAYDHWAPTAPSGGTAANCLHVAMNGTWTDAACTTKYAYVCKRVLP